LPRSPFKSVIQYKVATLERFSHFDMAPCKDGRDWGQNTPGGEALWRKESVSLVC
jgi:hypothetical protein